MVDKFTKPPYGEKLVEKINEIIDNLGGGGSVDAYTKAETDVKLAKKQDKFETSSPLDLSVIISKQECITVVGSTFTVPSNYYDITRYNYSTGNLSYYTLPTSSSGNGIIDFSKVMFFKGDLKNVKIHIEGTNRNSSPAVLGGKLDGAGVFTPYFVAGGNYSSRFYTSPYNFTLTGSTVGNTPLTIWTVVSNSQVINPAYGSGSQQTDTTVEFSADANGRLQIRNLFDSSSASPATVTVSNVNYEDWDANCLIFVDLLGSRTYNIDKFYIEKDGDIIWTPATISQDTYLSLNIGSGLAVQDGNLVNTNPTPVTVDQTFDATSQNAQSGVAINGAGFLKNTAIASNGLTIAGTPSTGIGGTNIGINSEALPFSTAVGYNAKANGVASIQLGWGTNTNDSTLAVGFGADNHYTLLDGGTGLIPYQRINAITDSNAGGSLKYWTGTRTQYDAIVTKDANTLYNITDDTDVTLTLLELLFPVGAVYFGTMTTCPLQTLGVGTWQALPPDKVIQIAGTRGAVGDTLNESLPNHQHNRIMMRLNQSGYGETIPANSGYFNFTGGSNAMIYTTSAISNNNKWNIGYTEGTSNSAYQDNAPVQQDAYLLNGWRRIA